MNKKQKKISKTLALTKETLLNIGDLDKVVGGQGCNVSRNSGCACSFTGKPVEQ